MGRHADGAAHWPGIRCSEVTYARLETRARARGAGEPNARDLYLAAALADAQPGAHAAFDRAFLAPTRAALARLGLAADEVDDALQRAREKLLVPREGADCLVAVEAGTGELAALVRVVAVRTGIEVRRRRRPVASDDGELVLALAAPGSPEAALVRAELRAELERALRAAIAALGQRERTLLRLHLFDRLGIDDLARLYEVHRATAARWLGRIHDQLERDVRAELAARLGADESAGELFALVRSSLHSGFVSVWDVVRSAPEAASEPG